MKGYIKIHDGKIIGENSDGTLVFLTNKAETQAFADANNGYICSSSVDFPEEYGVTSETVDAVLL